LDGFYLVGVEPGDSPLSEASVDQRVEGEIGEDAFSGADPLDMDDLALAVGVMLPTSEEIGQVHGFTIGGRVLMAGSGDDTEPAARR
jgi:hypothetical protein